MIRYTLTCDQDHHFDSWFQSGAAFDVLAKAGHLACTVCGSAQVSRALMAPAVSSNVGKPDKSPTSATKTDLKTPDTEAQAALVKLRADVEANSDYVGLGFAQEARKMHEGDAPTRSIYGEANLADAKKLIEDGVPVLPLPFRPKRKSN